MSAEQQEKVIGTHSGQFHCDEALACFMLRQTNEFKGAKVIRSRDPKVLDPLPILVDVGAQYVPEQHRYDHHQRGFFETFDDKHDIKLSSAGLVYKHFGREIIANVLQFPLDDPRISVIFPKLYDEFIKAIDAVDNGIEAYDLGEGVKPRYVAKTTLSHRVGYLQPAWNDPQPASLDDLFEEAVSLTGSEFLRALKFIALSWLPAREMVLEALQERHNIHGSGQVILLNNSCPWKEHLMILEKELGLIEPHQQILYALFADTAGSWRIQCVPKGSEGFENRKSLPEPWRGKRDEELSACTSVPGCIFIHASGFIGGAATKEAVLQLASLSLEAPSSYS
eukprot:CAMPEP_0184347258 /NCGR_PEP_ID=MMETSP1089-20130417/15383_1 /TAXON_ID=38269 ORGANISM="Gloeochaete wittrockiana, Strain SAG46.84" /NCGR_SAMPLE_ID=MMETSP1089 /ASSEMBLY_ACC=CAM_ASM_000445 /LENGTH=337 /DNA_ID=CAMNT_0026678229 /DNA_START=191 /DNA_END=1201 /DNA_ORIENTATION=+